MAAPGIVIEPFRDLRPEWILVDVFEQAEKIGFFIAQDCLIPALEQMADGPVPVIEVHGVCLVDALHDLGKRDVSAFDQEMDVVAHQNIGEDAAARAVLVDGEGKEVLLEVGAVLEDALFLVAADDDVIECSGIFDAWLAWHG